MASIKVGGTDGLTCLEIESTFGLSDYSSLQCATYPTRAVVIIICGSTLYWLKGKYQLEIDDTILGKTAYVHFSHIEVGGLDKNSYVGKRKVNSRIKP